MNEKKGKVKIILISTLVIIIIGLIGLIIYDKCINKESPPIKPEEQQGKTNDDEQPSEIDEKTQTILIDKIKKYKLAGFQYIYKNDIKFTSNPDNGQLELIYYKYGDSLTKKNVDDDYKEIYGESISEYKNIICRNDNEPFCTYNNDEYKCDVSIHGHGSLGEAGFGYELDYYVVSSKKEKDIFEIDLLILTGAYHSGYNVNRVMIEDDYNELEWNDANREKINNHYIEYFHENIDKYTSGIKYRYTFKKVNDEYYLKGFSIVK